jgi:PAS domain S-box-containing protein
MSPDTPMPQRDRRGLLPDGGSAAERPPQSPEEGERAAALRRLEESGHDTATGWPNEKEPEVARAWSQLAARAFAQLAENVRDYAIFLMDTAGRVVFWGEGARLMTWWSKREAEGAHLRLLYMPGGSQDGTAEVHLDYAREHGEYTGEGERVRSDGSTFWAGVTLTALRDENSTLLGFAKVTRDLTARRAADAMLQAASAAAEVARADAVAASAAKSGFLATISHEIRTPLNAILGYHELLDLEVDGPLTSGQRRYLDRARASGRHLLGLVSEVLDFSRIEAEREPVSQTSFQVGGAVRAAIELVAPQARAKRIVLTDAVGGYAAGLSALGDEQRVRQVLVNLLANAIKFTSSRESEPGRVTISAGAAKSPAGDARATGEGPWVYIRVEDTGRGIHPDQLSAVFEPFVQADMTLTREHGGTGLGLAIGRRLARLMGGDLTARSEPGLGSAFLLWLPAAPAESLQSAGVRGHGPAGEEERGDERAEHDRARQEAGTRPTILESVADALLAEIENIMRAYVARLRMEKATPSANTVEEHLLEDHVATFLADLSSTLTGVDVDSEAPTQSVRDGSAIQRLVAERHGAQRARMGFEEHELRREFVILEEEVRAAVQRRLPAIGATPTFQSAAGEAGRAMTFLHQALRIAEELSLQGFHRARAIGEPPGVGEQRAGSDAQSL